MYGPPEMAQAPTAITILGGGIASQVFFSARRMFSVTGPVMSSPSACRGEATNWMPKRAKSKTGVPSTFTSDSQPLQPPALTTRSFSDRPKRRRVRRLRCAAQHEVVAGPRGEAVFAGEGDGALGAGLHAFGTEEAAAQVEAQPGLVGDGARRAGLDAGAAAV